MNQLRENKSTLSEKWKMRAEKGERTDTNTKALHSLVIHYMDLFYSLADGSPKAY